MSIHEFAGAVDHVPGREVDLSIGHAVAHQVDLSAHV